MQKPPLSILAAVLASQLGGMNSRANVTLPPLFSEHAVLQKSAKTLIWGVADPGEAVTVTLGPTAAHTVAGADGKWRAELDLSTGDPGPYQLKVSGKNELTVPDVVVGDVWVCSGQSNMEFQLNKAIDAPQEIARSANPMLRQFLVDRVTALQPADRCGGHWTVAGPETSGNFTAVGYYFGQKLQNDLKIPIGLVHSSWGGTPSEAWTSAEAIDQDPDLEAGKERDLKLINDYPAKKKQFVDAMMAWLKQTGREDRPADPAPFAAPDASTAGWVPVKIPGPITGPGLPPTGALWLRREVVIPPDAIKQKLAVDLQFPNAFDTVYWNGVKIGGFSLATYPGDGLRRHYDIPPQLLKSGANVVAVRLFAPLQAAEINGNPDAIQIGTIPLAGEWLAKAEFALPSLDAGAVQKEPPPLKTMPALQYVATGLFNSMINPLLPFAIKGVIWYQGEANVARAEQYRTAFPLLITDWRKHWGEGDFPFYFCQLASFLAKKETPGESSWAELREAQTHTLTLPNTGMATLIDIGEAKDIHPRDKKDVGERLALIALANTYGKSVPFAGPMYAATKTEGNRLVLRFSHTDGGLVARSLPALYVLRSLVNQTAPLVLPKPGSQVQGFAVCGADKQWHWADAKIEGDTVIVSAPEVPQPLAVRYAWADDPTCNLYNGAGLPAVPFRTDDFPEMTSRAKY